MKNVVAVVAFVVLLAFASADQTRFTGKNVLVTGGSSGIGFQTALQFAQEGANVIIAARDSNPDYHTVAGAVDLINDDEVVKQNGGHARGVKADLTNPRDVETLFSGINSTEKILDIAVNAAGIIGPLGNLGDTNEYTGTMNDPILNNVYAVLRSIAEEEAIMVDKNISGVIINVAGVEGILPIAYAPLFGASKYATIGTSNSVAMNHITADNPPYIRVNSVAVGHTGTPFLYNQAKYFALKQQPFEGEYINETSPIWQESAGNFTKDNPMGRIAEPKEIANTILWLCTDEAEFISADTVIVDGGQWAV